MKYLILCSVILALAAAEIDEIRDKHTEKHQNTVNTARDGLLQKLSKIEGKAGDFGTYSGNTQVHLGNSYSASGVEDLSSAGSSGCRLCTASDDVHSSYNSRQSSNSQYRNSDYRGVGTVYNSDDRRVYASEHDDDDVQSFVTPVNSRFASARRQQEESDLSSVSSSAYRKAQMSEFSEGDLQRTVSSDAGRYRYPTNEGSSRLSSSSQSTQRQSENLRTATTFDEGDEQSRVQPTHRVTAVVRPGQNVRIAYVPGQGVSSSRIDAASSGSETNSHYVQPSSSSQTYRVYYKPVYTYQPSSNSYQATTNSESDRISSGSTAQRINGVQKPEKLTNYDSFHDSSRGSQSRVQTEERDYDTQQRVTPAPVYQPANGGSSRYSSQSSQSGQTQNSSSRYASSRPASGRVADSDYQASTRQGTAYYSAPSSASQTRSNSESQGQQRQSSSFSPYLPPQSSRTHQSLSSDRDTQFTSFNNRFSQTGSDDLRNMMSETQKLADLRRSQISSGTSNRYDSAADVNSRVYKTAADLDSASASFVNSRNSGFDELAADRNVAAGSNGGYQKFKSWNRQSQWSSGSEWGPDGKQKTYSSLSTGEAEKYNINGEEAGYKAATSTVEKDGKVATYSMHE